MKRIVLDNEAVQALLVPGHSKKRVVQAHLQAQVGQRRRGSDVGAVVPAAVRVEAGWDRSDPAAAGINRLLIPDVPLDGTAANTAASIQASAMVGVADAHLGATVRALGDDIEIVVLTSDPDDVRRVCGDRSVTTVRV